ncbi:hypothetical protein HK099_007039 [Clydaea vesicula]|uniref:Uncharacterized protein n=1 Tax=Clydaea vesicula TaxID=447962 RepID=A0AAD5XTX2_9FUNG|nr:hypothetical protein HK099_007039 [Clydaea vesicula]
MQYINDSLVTKRLRPPCSGLRYRMKVLDLSLVVSTLVYGTSAWRLQTYRHKDYVDRIEDRTGMSGTGRNQCFNVRVNDAASSFKWAPCHGEGTHTIAKLTLYKHADCREAFGWATNNKDWNMKLMATNDQLSSYRVHEEGQQLICPP